MRLSEDVINDIRSSASITEVIGHYIPLVKKGRGYTALCPFHDDHDPSLSISEDKQIYKCFVCGNGGNVFTFVQNFKKCTFLEAVIEVSNIIGKPIQIDLPTTPKRPSKYEHFYQVMNETVQFTNYLLSSKGGKKALDYLVERGLSKEIIDQFQIGYNPKENVLYQYLKSKGFKDEVMIQMNLARMNDYGMSDVFYERILFPIHDPSGNPIAFTARDLSGTSTSKYINTKETELYHKGDVIYNYHRAKDSAKSANRILVCEGVMDVIAFVRAGIDNVVATLGTACTKKQIELLASLSKNIVLAYDGDAAGQNAILKVGTLCLEAGLNVSVIFNETGLDPDEIIAKYGEKALRDHSSKQVTYLDFVFDYYKNRKNLENYNDRKEVTIIIGNLIDKLHDEYDRENYTKALYDLTKIRKIKTNTGKIEYNDRKAPKIKYSIDGLTMAEYTILSEMALSRQACEIYQRELGFLLDDKNDELAILIIEDYRKKKDANFARLYDEVEDEALKELIQTLSTNETLPTVYNEEILMGAISRIKREIQLKKLEQLEKKLKESSIYEPEKTDEYLKEYMEITKEIGGTYGKQ